jgi:hypothetical protein
MLTMAQPGLLDHPRNIPVMQPEDWIKRRYFQVGHVAAISSNSMYVVVDTLKIIVTSTTIG